mmetsp:Transcript_12375/g.21164  ORF Transcript_12375/g.21164 Transcript_12375/m.21164 type:complete len:489 (-) Transcript_12375:251-1717(-)|eukprot:CAMPEP_0171496374 /NCGR_PEP_ID=MMETSP0958-20121227/6669_1 /TAXON_ID=87120 /ORGANISM="Aurantiochytrium limacinum, Strain ATCCMYA-1381" /LENGTH=488 /DNA_ID=CAMNT_0012030475 /DNA_START=171 /DNA_END=1637 /DNA_ORIENTATION=-
MTSMKKEDVLANKLAERYANGDPEATEFIVKETRKFLASKSGRKLCASDIQQLERKLEAGIKDLKRVNEARARGEAVKEDVVLHNERTQQQKESTAEEKSDIPLDSYLVFATASEYEHQKAERERIRRTREKQRKMKEELDQQVEASRNKNGETIRIEEEYAQHVRQQYSSYLETERNKRVNEIERQHAIKEERDRQLGELIARRERAAQRERDQEAALIQRALEGIKHDEENQRKKLREQREYMERVQAANLKNKAMRAQERSREQEEEKRLQQEYARRLDEQERMRAETYARMKAKSSNNQAMYVAATAAKDAHDREVEARALAYQEQLAREAEERHQAELARREHEKVKLNEALAEQIRRAKTKEEQEKKAQEIFAEAYKADAENALAEEKRQQRIRQQKALEHKAELQRQMQEKLNRTAETDPTAMSPQEKLINLPHIRKLVSDDDVVGAIQQRMEKSKIAAEAKKRTKLGIRGGPADLQDEDF